MTFGFITIFVRYKVWKVIAVSGVAILVAITEVAMAQGNSILAKTEFNQITGWLTADKGASFKAFMRSCHQMKEDGRAFAKKPRFGGTRKDWRTVCDQAGQLGHNPGSKEITAFFQERFTPLIVNDPERAEGLFTGYFEPVVKGSLKRTAQYQISVYRRPDDLLAFSKSQEKKYGLRYGRLVDGEPTSYFTRQEIEQGLFDGQNLELVWLKSRADAFFMQVQGSGRVELTDGSVMRLAYAGKTGLPYTAIGAVLVNDGQLKKADLSMQSIRKWMTDNPSKAQSLMWKNQSFVFFRRLPKTNAELGPVGAQHVNLTPNVSLAIDRRYWAFGTPVWLDTKISFDQSTNLQTWQSLLIAQDTGSAIRGYARGDVFWGSSEKAAIIAGHMKAAGQMIVLLPNALARKLVD